MRFRLCFPFIFPILWQFASAFPGLVERGDCDSIVCPPSAEEIFDGVVGAGAAVLGGVGDIFNGAVGAAVAVPEGAAWLGNELGNELGNDIQGFLKSPEPAEPQTSPTPATQGEPNSDDAQQSSEPTADINLSVIGTPTPQLTNSEKCQSPSISDDDPGSDQVSKFLKLTQSIRFDGFLLCKPLISFIGNFHYFLV